jgi:hypothetical protein
MSFVFTDLAQAPDEESIGMKTLYALLYDVHLRGVAEPEAAHSKWNDARRGLRDAGFLGCILKGTLLSNLNHGHYMGGKNLQMKQECVEELARCVNDDWLDDHCEDIAWDRGSQPDCTSSIADYVRGWYKARSIRTRGAFVGCLPNQVTVVSFICVCFFSFVCWDCHWLRTVAIR